MPRPLATLTLVIPPGEMWNVSSIIQSLEINARLPLLQPLPLHSDLSPAHLDLSGSRGCDGCRMGPQGALQYVPGAVTGSGALEITSLFSSGASWPADPNWRYARQYLNLSPSLSTSLILQLSAE